MLLKFKCVRLARWYCGMRSRIHPKDETYTPYFFWFDLTSFGLIFPKMRLCNVRSTFSLIRLSRAHEVHAIAELYTRNKRGEEQKHSTTEKITRSQLRSLKLNKNFCNKFHIVCEMVGAAKSKRDVWVRWWKGRVSVHKMNSMRMCGIFSLSLILKSIHYSFTVQCTHKHTQLSSWE